MTHDAPLAILADIGGTNTRVALADGAVVRPASVRRFRNAEFRESGLTAILRQYLAEEGAEPDRIGGACIAVAGPVRKGIGRLTNLDWTMDLATLAKATGARRVAILNDLQAQGHALAHLDPTSLRTILPGREAEPNAARLVIGVGTGFNAAPVHCVGPLVHVAASECGHVTLPVRAAAELELAQFLEAEHGFAAVEEVLSGRGIEAVDLFVARQTDPDARSRGAVEVMTALAANEARAVAAARLFVTCLGRVAGDLALTHLPFAGVYLVGGVARAFTPWLEPLGFGAAFRDKGRFAGFLDAFPVRVVEDDYAALAGCATHLEALRVA